MAKRELLDTYGHPEMCNSSNPVKSLKLLIDTSEILFNSHKYSLRNFFNWLIMHTLLSVIFSHKAFLSKNYIS